MAYVPFTGFFPDRAPGAVSAGAQTINATGQRVAWVGSVLWPDRSVTSRAIRRIRFRFGNITKTGGSALTLSLQNIDTANGSPGQPDGTQDQTVAIANANASFASNTNFLSGDLSADRTVSFGERIGVVLEFDGAGRLGSDSVVIQNAQHNLNGLSSDGPLTYNGSAWTAVNGYNNLSFECADGELAILSPFLPTASTLTTTTGNTGTTPDEFALEFTPAFNCKIDGLWASVAAAATADYEIILYQGTTALQTVAVDANTLRSATYMPMVVSIPETTLTAGTTYYVAVRPTTANNVSVYFADAASNAILQAHLGGVDTAYYTTRTDAGSWASATTTRRLMAGVRLSAIDNGSGAGAGGGMLRHPGMTGGFSA